MKNFFSLLLLFVVVSLVSAQTRDTSLTSFPWTEDFESGAIDTMFWSNPGGHWTMAGEVYEGSYAAKVSYSHAGEAILMTPAIELPENMKLTFYWKDDDITSASEVVGHDTTYCEISTDMVEWTELAYLSESETNDDYFMVEKDLSAYGNQTVYLRWRDVNDASWSAYGTGLDYITIEGLPNNTADWMNLQWPPTAEITVGESFTAYAQIYEAGLTDTTTVASDEIQVWFGVSDEDTDPSTWTDWVEADFNDNVGNNDEYMADLGNNLAPGTYYYASRAKVGGGPATYGGYSSGFWDGTTNVSGVLTINTANISDFPYSEDFELGQVPPVGFLNPDGAWGLGTESHLGDYCARVAYNHPVTEGAVLQTPVFNLPDADMRIKFWWKDDDISTSKNVDINSAEKDELDAKEFELNPRVATHDTTFFEITTDGGSTWTMLEFLAADEHQSAYQEVSVDLSAYAEETVSFRWRDITDATSQAYGTGVDDIVIEEVMDIAPNPAVISSPADSTDMVGLFPTISWNNGGGDPTGYKVYFGDSEAGMTMVADVTEDEYDITGPLAWGTMYYWQIVPYNDFGDASDCPVWVFTTQPDPTVTVPFSTDFEDSFPPYGWERMRGFIGDTLTSSSAWYSDDFGNVTSPVNKAAKVNIYGTSRRHWLITPPIVLTEVKDGSGMVLKFDLALTGYGNTSAADLGEDDKFVVLISDANDYTGTSAETLQEWNSTTPISNTGEEVTISLDGYSGAVRIGFYGESTITNVDNDLFVDNVYVGPDDAGETVSFSVMDGWNMFSIPANAADGAVTSLVPSVASDVFEYNGSYATVSELNFGMGYWAKFDAEETFEYEADGAMPTEIEVVEGWNLIGSFAGDVNVADLNSDPANIVESAFFSFNGVYVMDDALASGKAYWVKASEAGTLYVTPDVPKKSPIYVETVDQAWGKITLTDAAGRTVKLYAAEDEVANHFLPPVAPAGIFDARFSTQKYAENISNSAIVDLKSAQYPLTVRIDGMDLKVQDNLGGSFVNTLVKDGEQVVIREEVGSLIFKVNNVPTDFALEQNYPNPFNPSTTINFSLPEAAKVNIKIYNVLGEVVSTILSREVEAGYHTVNFNASGLSSGIYFYSIEAGSFNDVKKMMLLK